MTRTQALMALIEAHNPISHSQMRQVTGWNRRIVTRALDRLQQFGAIRQCHIPGKTRKHYRPA